MWRWADGGGGGGGGGGAACGSGGEGEVRVSRVSVTKAAIWGQTRGCREEQRMTPMEGGVGDDMASWWRWGEKISAGFVGSGRFLCAFSRRGGIVRLKFRVKIVEC